MAPTSPPAPKGGRSIWVFGDQLSRRCGPLAAADPAQDRILFVVAASTVNGRAWHRQRLHLILTGMARLADELRADGFSVDWRQADTFAAGLAAHRAEFAPDEVVAMAPSTHRGRANLARLGVTQTADDRFLTDPADAAELFAQKRPTMETFYRWQRRRLGYLMDGDEPATGRWNYDAENRKPLPKGGAGMPEPVRDALDARDAEVMAALPLGLPGADPAGWWPTDRAGALARLQHAIDVVLPNFGPYEDAMSSADWHVTHTLLSPALNLGLLHPREVADAIEAAWRSGAVPIASAEGLLRQIIGWREYVWCVYWHEGPDYASTNALHATRPLPPVYSGAPTRMRCVGSVLADVEAYGWTHHIPRLMVLANLALLSGVDPAALSDWMWERFVDGAEWVMWPNVFGMGLYADGGRMATKPYAAGGAYIDKMSDFCKGCAYDRKARTGERACPFTTLYWDFLARHAERFASNHRMARQVAACRNLADLDAVRVRAATVLAELDAGTL